MHTRHSYALSPNYFSTLAMEKMSQSIPICNVPLPNIISSMTTYCASCTSYLCTYIPYVDSFITLNSQLIKVLLHLECVIVWFQ